MPDPNLTLAAIQSHTTALDGAIRRSVANSGWFKVGSAVVVLGFVLLASGKAQMAALPWVAGVVVLLALADACQVVMGRICTDAYNGFMRKLPLNGGNAMKAEECFVLPAPDPGWRQAGQVLGALGSLSVLPFYGALLALVIAFHVQTSPEGKSARLLPSAAPKSGCSAGGGCGTSGGCGSGGCGASSGKGCGCGSEAKAKAVPTAAPVPQAVSKPLPPRGPLPPGAHATNGANGTNGTNRAMGMLPAPTRATPFPSQTLFPPPGSATRQTLFHSPSPPDFPAPGVRPLTLPPAKVPENTLPPEKAVRPPNAAPKPNGAPRIPKAEGQPAPSSPLQNGTPSVPKAGPALQSPPAASGPPTPPESPPAHGGEGNVTG